jgi:putative FmdB family regulatory protein
MFNMPAYEYKCDSCEIHFEIRQKMSEQPLETCPECGGEVHRLISGGAGAITKGSQSSAYSNPSSCGFGGPCCAQGEMCCANAARGQ